MAGDVVDNGDGTYDIRYTPVIAGEYTVSVHLLPMNSAGAGETETAAELEKRGAEPVLLAGRRAATTANVVHSHFSAAASTAAGHGLMSATSQQHATFLVYARDGSGNLRVGNQTGGIGATANGNADAFRVELSGPSGQVVATSTAVTMVYVRASGGRFTVSYDGRASAPLDFNAPVTALEAEISRLASDAYAQLLANDDAVPSSTLPGAVAGSGGATLGIEAGASTDAGSKGTSLIMLEEEAGSPKAVGGTTSLRTFRLTVVDSALLRNWSPAKLTVEDVSLTGASPSVAANATAAGGVYPVRYSVHERGDWTARIFGAKSNGGLGQEISGSPWFFTVAPGPANAGASLADGSGLIGGTVGARESINVTVRDMRVREVQIVSVRAVAHNDASASAGLAEEQEISCDAAATGGSMDLYLPSAGSGTADSQSPATLTATVAFDATAA